MMFLDKSLHITWKKLSKYNDYTTVGLKDVNITLFWVMTFILVYLRKPLKIKKFVSYYIFSMILKQLTAMFKTA